MAKAVSSWYSLWNRLDGLWLPQWLLACSLKLHWWPTFPSSPATSPSSSLSQFFTLSNNVAKGPLTGCFGWLWATRGCLGQLSVSPNYRSECRAFLCVYRRNDYPEGSVLAIVTHACRCAHLWVIYGVMTSI